MKQNKNIILNILAAAFCLAVFLSFSYFRVFDEFELSTLDLRFKLRPDQPVDPGIVIVHIGDNTIEKLGEWPIPRKYHALLVRALKSSNVKSMIFDIFFSEETKDDQNFSDAVRKAGNVYMPYVFDLDMSDKDREYGRASRMLAPLIPELKNVSKGTGFINVEPDIDGKVRKIISFIEYEDGFSPHLTILAALDMMGIPFKDVVITPGERIAAGKKIAIPLSDKSTMLVNYIEILQSYLAKMTGKEPVIDLSELEGTVCFVGFTAAASPDAHPSPLEPLYPGVGVHASIYNSIIQKLFIRRLNRWWNLIILLAVWIITWLITVRVRKRFAVVSIGLFLTLVTVLSIMTFWIFGLWIDLFYPLITVVGLYVLLTFKMHLAETRRREVLEKELDIAKEIQESFLPTDIPQVGGLDLSARMLTARQVGGDLYDIVQLDDNRLGIMLGDVSGKGVPAALFMARVVSVFKSFVKEGGPSEIVKNVNGRLVDEDTSNLFVTLTFIIFDTEKKIFKYASGGHNPTVFVRPGGEVEMLDVEEGMPLGLIDGEFSEVEKQYEPGSIIVLYTDGVTEAMNVREEMFGEEKLVELCRTLKDRPAEEIVKAIHARVAEFAGKAKQHDDITVLVIKT